MGKDWLNIRIKTEPAKIKYVTGQVEAFAEQAIGTYFFQFMQKMMPEAVDVMQNYIRYQAGKTTKTGKPGRVVTGTMWESVKWRQVSTGKKGYYRFELGWLDGKPGYSIFQEQGTKSGVIGMNALGYTLEWLRNEVVLLGRGSSKAVRTRNAKWKF